MYRENKNCTEVFIEKTCTNTLEDQDVNREIILKWILINRMGGFELDLCGSGQRQEEGCCQPGGNYNAGYTKTRGIS